MRIGAKKCGLLRVVARKCAKVRTDQARKSSIVRIVTGESNFFHREGDGYEFRTARGGQKMRLTTKLASQARHKMGAPNWVVRSRETWSRNTRTGSEDAT